MSYSYAFVFGKKSTSYVDQQNFVIYLNIFSFIITNNVLMTCAGAIEGLCWINWLILPNLLFLVNLRAVVLVWFQVRRRENTGACFVVIRINAEDLWITEEGKISNSSTMSFFFDLIYFWLVKIPFHCRGRKHGRGGKFNRSRENESGSNRPNKFRKF